MWEIESMVTSPDLNERLFGPRTVIDADLPSGLLYERM